MFAWLDAAAHAIPAHVAVAGSELSVGEQADLRSKLDRHEALGAGHLAPTLGALDRARGALIVPADRGARGVAVGRRAVALALALGDIQEHGSGGPSGMIGVVDRATQPLDKDDFHTDSSPWPSPNVLTILACVRPDPGGAGSTQVSWLQDALTQLRARYGPNPERVLREEPAWWPGAEGWQPFPVLRGGTLRWHTLVTYDRRSEWPEPPSPQWIGAADALRECLADARSHDIVLRAGQILLVDNLHAAHRRGPVDPGSIRQLLRLKVGP